MFAPAAFCEAWREDEGESDARANAKGRACIKGVFTVLVSDFRALNLAAGASADQQDLSLPFRSH
ncbi:MAG TPA: hypothetical protein VF666_13600 [Pyrinomonadaceae bacterium]